VIFNAGSRRSKIPTSLTNEGSSQKALVPAGVRGVSPFPYVLSPVPFHLKRARFVTYKESPWVNFDACYGLIAGFLPSTPNLLQLRQAIIERLEKGRV
jgi:hypothetical protein